MKHSAPLTHIVQRLTGNRKTTTSRHAVKIESQVKSLASVVKAMEDVAINRDPAQTEAAHEVKVANAARRVKEHGEKIKAQLHDAVAVGLNDIEDQIRTKTNFSAHPTYGPEIRQSLRLMTDQQRHEVVRQALDAGDGPTFAAIMEAPEITTGLNREHMTNYREAFEKKHATELVSQRQELYDFFDAGLASLTIANNAARDGLNPGRLREIEEAQARHAEASQAFESSVSVTSAP